jgi:hypothetical protein
MKRHGYLLPEILQWDNLLLAYCKAARGLTKKCAANRYSQNLDENLRILRNGLEDGSFAFGDYHSFQVRDPKCRTIHAPSFPERVAHHAIFNLCEPLLERILIDDSYACRKGRGTHAAILRARTYVRKHSFRLQLDVRKFFDSIPHEPLLKKLGRVFKDTQLLGLFSSILHGYEAGRGRGLPIGSLASQHFANFYLSGLDRLVKDKLRMPGYVRYMDDFVLWADDPHLLSDARTAIEGHLEGLSLSLKKLSQPVESSHGMSFLGHRIFPRRVELAQPARTRFVRKARRLQRKCNEGAIGELEMQQRHASLSGFGRQADMKRLQRRLLLDEGID